MRVEVDLPIPSGWVLAEDQMRIVKRGEKYLAIMPDGSGVIAESVTGHESCVRWIMREIWSYPVWLGGERVKYSIQTGWECLVGYQAIPLNSKWLPEWVEPLDKTRIYQNPKNE